MPAKSVGYAGYTPPVYDRSVANQTSKAKRGGRSTPMEVLSLGMSRTGTVSMCEAFKILGIQDPYHGFRFITHPNDGAVWSRAADAKFYGKGKPFTREDWDQVLGDHGAAADVGTYFFWRELAEAYPEAKIVLVERDLDRWYHSFIEGIIVGQTGRAVDFIVNFVEPLTGYRTASACRKMFNSYFGATNVDEYRRTAKEVYLRHYAEIREAFPAERLLNYELGSGWEPLCTFLDKPVPDVSFPHVNEAAEFKKIQDYAIREGVVMGLRSFAMYFGPVALAVGLGIYYMRK
ncbi:hypothetical protein MBLNU230_g5164t1 [Neophaeotheca triangularis]